MGPRVRTPQKFGCGIFYGSDPRENFTERNLMSAKSIPGAARLCKPIKRSKSRSLRTPLGELTAALPRLLARVKGKISSLRTTPPSPTFKLRSSALCGPRQFDGAPQCCRRIGAYGLTCALSTTSTNSVNAVASRYRPGGVVVQRVQILLEAITLRDNVGQVVHTYVPLSPSSITWYRPKGGDALRLGR